jgi:hypothetical protein
VIDVKQIFESTLQEAGAQITEAFGNYSGDAKRFELKFQEFQLFGKNLGSIVKENQGKKPGNNLVVDGKDIKSAKICVISSNAITFLVNDQTGSTLVDYYSEEVTSTRLTQEMLKFFKTYT